jgi:tetratricopeptide (TPR) repeat protein
VDVGRALLEEGRLDEALAKLQEAGGDAEALYLQGVAWGKKAETAPLPTPPPLTATLPRGAEPARPPTFKPEELTAVGFYEQALAAKPDHAAAHGALAELLSPHTLRRVEELEAAARSRRRPRGRAPEPVPAWPAEPGVPDYSPERVIREYQAAGQADPKATAPLDGLVRFAPRVGRLDAAEAALEELCRRQPEKPEPFVRYGEFLVNEKKTPEAAVLQYQQALVWDPGNVAAKSRIADIYIEMGIQEWEAQRYAMAEARFKEAQRYVSERNSPQGLKIQDYMGRLGGIRKH